MGVIRETLLSKNETKQNSHYIGVTDFVTDRSTIHGYHPYDIHDLLRSNQELMVFHVNSRSPYSLP